MRDKRLTIWEHAELQGVSRRDFLRFCSWMAAMAGIEASGIGKVVHAMDTKPRLPVVWFHFQECTCCSESFIRSSHPIVADIVLDKISLDYTETLQAAAGHQAEAALHDTMKNYRGEYLMLVEGSVPTADGGVYCCIGGRTALDIVKEAAEGSRLLGFVRLQWLHPGLKTQPHERHSDPQDHIGQAVDQSPRLPADRRGHGRHDRAPSGL
jgi:hydrogenase small subunit